MFDDVPVTKSARRLLVVTNSFDETVNVTVTKTPKPEYNVTLEWTSCEIAPQGSRNMELIWNPVKISSCREVIQISDENGNKKDVSVILKSCELKKTSNRNRVASTGGFPKKLKLKTPSPPQAFSRMATTSKTIKTYEVREILGPQQLISSPLRNTSNTPKANFFDRISYSSCANILADKENSSPQTPKNASALFDNIRFTPLTETKPKCESKLEYLASLPTPVGLRREEIPVNEATTRRNLMDAGISPGVLRQLGEQQLSTFRSTNYSKRIETVSVTEEIDEIQIIIREGRETLSNTHVVTSSSPLCVISEDEPLVVNTAFHKTFEVNKSLSLTDFSPNTSARASESMQEFIKVPDINVEFLRSNQGSMPNLNEMNTAVGSIEHNRYFHQQQPEQQLHKNLSLESIASNADFHETEICAQSSRLFLGEELGSPSKPGSKDNLKHLKGSKEAADSPGRASAHASPTMRRIQKEPVPRSPKQTLLTFSPPTHSKLSSEIRDIQRRETFDITSGGRAIRATTWKQQQNKQVFAMPKVPRELSLKPSSNLSTQSLNSLSSSSIASVASTSSVPARLTSGRLYNENYINAYSQKDPFSATTTIDPFLSSTMYLDERTLDNIEKTYKKWLNALVTIPPDLETDKNEKVDVGKLFNEVQNKELTLAPTKEVVCSRYYTLRLDSLRNTAVQFFHSETVSNPLNKLTVVINDKNKLDIKADRNIHLDLVLQRGLLELLLCYNPLWLRIGLEVVMNVQLNLTSNRDIFGMSRFIINNLFKSPYLAQKYNKFSQQEEYLDKLRKFTAKNFLFLIFFLDRAKECRLIKQNPCLFIKKAAYKESADILKKFASLVLANYGDIIRTLRRYDFVVTHKQTVIDEFDFAFKNLAVDLRDGVRLTKVMEIILLRDDLVQKVRVPGKFLTKKSLWLKSETFFFSSNFPFAKGL